MIEYFAELLKKSNGQNHLFQLKKKAQVEHLAQMRNDLIEELGSEKIFLVSSNRIGLLMLTLVGFVGNFQRILLPLRAEHAPSKPGDRCGPRGRKKGERVSVYVVRIIN